ncbi:MAG TPA: TA system VapC family ribonuclease toxin [Vicinamibacterales bacterium]|nr:TA system VapC family ribonuclease toxin [Vicinamibacterales bacterium]
MSRPALLDVNLLVALFDADHPHHETAHDWFADSHAKGWATCALTQNGLLRILANPRYGATINRPADLLKHLTQFCASKHHVFWADSLSLTDRNIFNPSLIQGHRQLTDIYLLGLAKKMGGSLATFDSGIPLSAVIGATRDTLSVIAASAE